MLPLRKSVVQDAMGAQGSPEFRIGFIESGHCPFLSTPEEMFGVLERIVARKIMYEMRVLHGFLTARGEKMWTKRSKYDYRISSLVKKISCLALMKKKCM